MGRNFEESMASSGGADDLETPINDKNRDKKSKNEKKKKTHKKIEEEEEEESANGKLAAEEETLTLVDSKPKKRKSAESELLSLEYSEKKTKKKKNKDKDLNGEDRVLEEAGANGVEGVKGVVVTGKDAKDSKYKAFDSFADAGLSAEVLDCCKNFSKPSPIQANSWPFLLSGRDLIGIAATGSGKTLAFGVPALVHILQKDDKKTSKKAVPRCLVLSPTRELAQQMCYVMLGLLVV